MFNFASGTTATGFCGLGDGWVTAGTQPGGGGAIILSQNIGFDIEARITAPVLSTSAQEFAINFGFSKQRNASQKTPADAAVIIYDRTSAVSTTTWLAAGTTGGVGTPSDTGVAVTAGTFNRLRLKKWAGETTVFVYSAGVYSAGVQVATITGYNSTELLSLMCFGFKSVGTTSTSMARVDWVNVEEDFPEMRVA